MNQSITSTIKALHDKPHVLTYNFAGAGVDALAWLHAVAGSSRTVLEAVDCYSPTSMQELLGFEPDKFVSATVSQTLAAKALARSKKLNQSGMPCLGLSCTASIATDYKKRGLHQACISVADNLGTSTYQLILEKGARNRDEEEALVSQLVIKVLADTCHIDMPALNLRPNDKLSLTHQVNPLFEGLLKAEIAWLSISPEAQLKSGDTLPQKAMLSGAFNPLHAGHITLSEQVAQQIGQPVSFELPLVNAEKAPIDLTIAMQRARQFIGKAEVLFSCAPLFYQKAEIFPQSIFVIGADTALRLVEPRFYDSSEEKMLASFDKIREKSCRFIVAGRLIKDEFIDLSDIAIPKKIAGLFEALPEEDFRMDISSSQIRNRKKSFK